MSKCSIDVCGGADGLGESHVAGLEGQVAGIGLPGIQLPHIEFL